MARVILALCVACIIACSQSTDPSETRNGAQDLAPQTIKHGRVSLVAQKVEAGNPNDSAIQTGLDSATSVLNDLLKTENLSSAAGTFAGRFRLESDGTVRIFLTDKSTSLTNGDGLEDAFVGAAFGGKCSFPELGDIAMVYAEFKIDLPQ